MPKSKDQQEIKRLALQLVVQLPINIAAALKVLECAKEILERVETIS